MDDLSNACVSGLWDGVRNGWWQDVDEAAMLPVRVFRRDEFHEHATWAHVWMRLGRFVSMKEAKRAGQNVPLARGERRLGTWIARVV